MGDSLFITKQRGKYASSGLRNFVRFIIDMLTPCSALVSAVLVRLQDRRLADCLVPMTPNATAYPATNSVSVSKQLIWLI